MALSQLSKSINLDIEAFATLGIGFFLTAIMIVRLIGTLVLHYLSERKFFLINAILGLIGILGLFLGIQIVSLVSIFIAGMAFGNILPLIFSILIDKFPQKSSELSGLMCMAIVSGAIIPLLMGLIADYNVMASFIVPLLSFDSDVSFLSEVGVGDK